MKKYIFNKKQRYLVLKLDEKQISLASNEQKQD